MLVREIVVGKIVHIQFRPAVGLIVDALPPFFLHRVALVVQIRLRDVQRLHAVCFQEQPEIELIFRQLLEIGRAVLVRGAVHSAAVVQHLDEMFALAHVCRALKHHVLEEMRKSRAPRPLVAASDVVANVYGIHRRAMVRHQNHAQPVVELHFAKFKLR